MLTATCLIMLSLGLIAWSRCAKLRFRLSRRNAEIQEVRSILIAEWPKDRTIRDTHALHDLVFVFFVKHFLRLTSEAQTGVEEQTKTAIGEALIERDAALEQCTELKQKLEIAEAARVAQRNDIMEVLGLRRHSIPPHRPIGDDEQAPADAAGLGVDLLASIPDEDNV